MYVSCDACFSQCSVATHQCPFNTVVIAGSTSPERGSASGSEDDDASGGAGSGAEGAGELLVEDAALPARALASLNALRKSRQHYDVLLLAGGEETPAHRAVLAAASPYLLQALADAGAGGAPPLLRVHGVQVGSQYLHASTRDRSSIDVLHAPHETT